MEWDVDAELRKAYDGHSLGRSVKLENDWLKQHYPAIAAHEIDLIQAAASMFGSTSWVASIGEVEQPPWGGLGGNFRLSSGALKLNQSHLQMLDDALAGRLQVLSPDEAHQVRGAVHALLHELIHSMGPADRRQVIANMQSDFHPQNGSKRWRLMVSEGLTELATSIFADEYIKRIGLDKLTPGVLHCTTPMAYSNWVDMVKKRMTASGLASNEQEQRTLIAEAVRNGSCQKGLAQAVRSRQRTTVQGNAPMVPRPARELG